MDPGSHRRSAFCVKLARALLLVGAMAFIAGSSWNAVGATTPDRSAFLPGGWAVDDALAFNPFNPWSPIGAAGGRGGRSRPLMAARGGRPPPRIPYRPPLRTPYKPPWP